MSSSKAPNEGTTPPRGDASSSSKAPDQAPPSSESSESSTPPLELIIFTHRVGLYPPSQDITSDELAHSAMTSFTPEPSGPSTNFTRLLSGPLGEFCRYSRQEKSKWLIDIAHDICDPSQKRGTLKKRIAHGGWRTVNPAHQLTASIYLYDVQNTVSLSKISGRVGRSRTTTTSNASTMRNRVIQRDGGQCWVSNGVFGLVNNHVCPKRMGDHLLRFIYETFESSHVPPALSIYDEICGITLTQVLGTAFDTYEFGLRPLGPNRYECHAFVRPEELTIHGIAPTLRSMPLLQGHPISPPQPDGHNPPPGLFRWHYLQCILRKFAHDDYRNLQNIGYPESCIRMEGDSDNEDIDGEYDWPSAILDCGRAMEASVEQHKEGQRSVAEWVAAV